MPYFSVKCWKSNSGIYKSLLVEADSKEMAKSMAREHQGLIPVGAREVALDSKGRKYIVPTTGREHRKEVEQARKENKETKSFVVTFVAHKDGHTKTTVVRATDARNAKAQVAQFGKAVRAEVAKGKGKKAEPPVRKSPKDKGTKLIKGVEVYPVTSEEIEERIRATRGWTSFYIERAGSVNSGMTKI